MGLDLIDIVIEDESQDSTQDSSEDSLDDPESQILDSIIQFD